jgi:hypothetical protein
LAGLFVGVASLYADGEEGLDGSAVAVKGLSLFSCSKKEVSFGNGNRASVVCLLSACLGFELTDKILKLFKEFKGVEEIDHEIGVDLSEDHLDELNLSHFNLESII